LRGNAAARLRAYLGIVAKVPFFKPLSPAAIIEIARSAPIDRRAHRDRAPGPSGRLHVFHRRGLVEIRGRGRSAGGGAFFGEMALLGDGTRTAAVTAVVPTTLLVLELTDYRIFAAHYPNSHALGKTKRPGAGRNETRSPSHRRSRVRQPTATPRLRNKALLPDDWDLNVISRLH
jgi:hypothetical protein